MRFSTTLRQSNAFRGGAIAPHDHARHLSHYLGVLATLRERNASLVLRAVASRAYDAASKDRAFCLFCVEERSAKIARAVARGAVMATRPPPPVPARIKQVEVPAGINTSTAPIKLTGNLANASPSERLRAKESAPDNYIPVQHYSDDRG